MNAEFLSPVFPCEEFVNLLVSLYFLITLCSGKSSALSSSAKRAGNLIRPTSPKSPVASASAFESMEGSDDEDNLVDNTKLDATYLRTNGNAVSSL